VPNAPPQCNSRYDENHFDVFLQEQWSPSKRVDVVLGYRLDRHPLLASSGATPGGLIHSGRGSVIFSLTREHVLRVSGGTSFRAPTFFESYTGLFAPVPNQPAVGVDFSGSRNLKPESIWQAELGYRGRLLDRISLEAVVYGQRVTDLILDTTNAASTPKDAVDPRTGNYIVGFSGFENRATKYYGIGGELGTRWTPMEGLELGLNYAYEQIYDCTNGCSNDISQLNLASSLLGNTAQHKVNALLLWRTKANIDLSVDAHWVSGVTWVENIFDPFNPNAVGGTLFQRYDLDAYALINGRVGYQIVKNKLDVGLAVYNLFGDRHREHPYGNQIGRRVTVTASGAF
jgi:iron complex outermembrane receptor protein